MTINAEIMKNNEKITWIASYPKSGSTWLRMLIGAYKQNGYVDINESLTCSGDNIVTYAQMVSPLPLENLGVRGKLLIRPTALLAQLSAAVCRPVFVKTHNVNGVVSNLPHLIPVDLTERAIYIVRDPRDIVSSFANHVGTSIEEAVESMNRSDYGLDGSGLLPHYLNTWSEHVRSWIGIEHKYPIHLIKYEDMVDNPARELRNVLEFCNMEVDDTRLRRSVNACTIEKLRDQELDAGFIEKKNQKGTFFNRGGSRWKYELSEKIVRSIENDHHKAMVDLDYDVAELSEVG